MICTISQQDLQGFRTYLEQEDKSRATVQKYMLEMERFCAFLQDQPLDKEAVRCYREYLNVRYRATTVNGKLAAIHTYLKYVQRLDCTVKFLKVQRNAVREEKRDLTDAEYRRLLIAARRKHNRRLYFVMMTICATGIRVGEVSSITVEALQKGYAQIQLKGKNRIIVLPKELTQQLLDYARGRGIHTGMVFRTRNGTPLDRSNLCRDMKKLCAEANVSAQKVFPHNLRHLFARTFYAMEKDIAHLADILGHSSIETTRIYLTASASTYENMMQKMKLIL